ncbi:hypothetical protein C7212DRAFT_365362 [Tuber magnatum]|uniref:Cytochrome b5 heme-binding domain-containing protein n=1 Tax=Tuber magnatum TaxID=42249 RepID=A0A317SKT7_9PEZI|nr:hypothetical protein C7212DRAFT_365362 [Tuber magnatum]
MGWMRKAKDREHYGDERAEDEDLVEVEHIEYITDENPGAPAVKRYENETVPFLDPKVVAEHTSVEADSIRIMIDGIVYDVTTFVTEHRGGTEIIEYFWRSELPVTKSHLEGFKDNLGIGWTEGLGNKWPEQETIWTGQRGTPGGDRDMWSRDLTRDDEPDEHISLS